jgi:hypothetical protein
MGGREGKGRDDLKVMRRPALRLEDAASELGYGGGQEQGMLVPPAPPSATTTIQALQKAKNTRGSQARDKCDQMLCCSNTRLLAGHVASSVRRVIHEACSRPTRRALARLLRRLSCSLGETRRSYGLTCCKGLGCPVVADVSSGCIHGSLVALTRSMSTGAMAQVADQMVNHVGLFEHRLLKLQPFIQERGHGA